MPGGVVERIVVGWRDKTCRGGHGQLHLESLHFGSSRGLVHDAVRRRAPGPAPPLSPPPTPPCVVPLAAHRQLGLLCADGVLVAGELDAGGGARIQLLVVARLPVRGRAAVGRRGLPARVEHANECSLRVLQPPAPESEREVVRRLRDPAATHDCDRRDAAAVHRGGLEPLGCRCHLSYYHTSPPRGPGSAHRPRVGCVPRWIRPRRRSVHRALATPYVVFLVSCPLAPTCVAQSPGSPR